MNLKEQLEEMGACSGSIEWVGDKDIVRAWKECENPNWLLWYYRKVNPDDYDLILEAELACCKLIERFMNDKSKEALKVAEDYLAGKATIQDIDEEYERFRKNRYRHYKDSNWAATLAALNLLKRHSKIGYLPSIILDAVAAERLFEKVSHYEKLMVEEIKRVLGNPDKNGSWAYRKTLLKLGATPARIESLEGTTLKEAWEASISPSWLLWLYRTLKPDDLVNYTKAELACCELVEPLMTKSLKQSLSVARQFVEGIVDKERVNEERKVVRDAYFTNITSMTEVEKYLYITLINILSSEKDDSTPIMVADVLVGEDSPEYFLVQLEKMSNVIRNVLNMPEEELLWNS